MYEHDIKFMCYISHFIPGPTVVAGIAIVVGGAVEGSAVEGAVVEGAASEGAFY